MTFAAEIEDLQVTYGGHTVLDIPHLTVEEGEVLAIIGSNGSGKSTLLRVLALLERPSRGEVMLQGERVEGGGKALTQRRRSAIVLQHALLRNTSTFDNVATGLRFRRIPAREVKERVGLWLDRLGIGHLAQRNARTLSGGEAQRASLARALVLDPDLLLLDEPFAALDAPSRLSLVDDLGEVLSQVRVSTVFVTHDRTAAQALGNRVAVMMDGRIQQLGTPEEVFSSPVNETVAAFVGVENIMAGTARQQSDGVTRLRVRDGEIALVGEYTVGETLLACIRPEEVVLETSHAEGVLSSALNRLSGRVTRCVSLGSQCRVTVDCGFPLVSLVTRRSVSDLGLEEGVQVVASFKASAVHVIRRRVA